MLFIITLYKILFIFITYLYIYLINILIKVYKYIKYYNIIFPVPLSFSKQQFIHKLTATNQKPQ